MAGIPAAAMWLQCRGIEPRSWTYEAREITLPPACYVSEDAPGVSGPFVLSDSRCSSGLYPTHPLVFGTDSQSRTVWGSV
jgi:hypothetical protein